MCLETVNSKPTRNEDPVQLGLDQESRFVIDCWTVSADYSSAQLDECGCNSE